MIRTRLFFILALVAVFAGASAFAQEQKPAGPGGAADSGAQTAAPAGGAGEVGMALRNVKYHLTDKIIVQVTSLDGKMSPKGGAIPVFDDKNSFEIHVDAARITVDMTALTNDLNDYVFAKADAPIKKLSASAQGNELTIKGLLVSKGGIPFESTGTMSVTPEGMIRVHTTKVKALKLPVKGLMDMLGLDTEKLLNTKQVEGVSVDKDDLILDPGKILPPPELQGHLTSLKLENGEIHLVFGPADGKTGIEPVKESCGAKNYLHFRGNSVRFGRLTMSDTDLELVDAEPQDSFDFSIDHYKQQLVAGYSKSTQSGGLCVHMPDYSKLKHPAGAAKKATTPGATQNSDSK
ncbi:MAG TPA: hypothetical protein VGD60_06615 [Candidatus Acidoferrales bacterium]